AAASRTFWFHADIRGVTEQVHISGRVTIVLLLFHRPGRFGAFNLLEIGNASVFLTAGAGFYEVGDRNGGEQADDGHYDHDFHQRKAGFAKDVDLHYSFYLSVAA